MGLEKYFNKKGELIPSKMLDSRTGLICESGEELEFCPVCNSRDISSDSGVEQETSSPTTSYTCKNCNWRYTITTGP